MGIIKLSHCQKLMLSCLTQHHLLFVCCNIITTLQMVTFSSTRDSSSASYIPAIWVEDHTCRTAQNGNCKISSTKKSREYIVRVTATDEAGNVGVADCNTIVGDQNVANDPIFPIAKLNTIGGVEVEEATDPLTPEFWGETDEPLPADEPLPTNETLSPPWECKEGGEPAPGGCTEGVNTNCCSGTCSNNKAQLCKK